MHSLMAGPSVEFASRVLVMEKDLQLCVAIRDYAGQHGFLIEQARTGESALKIATQRRCQIVLLASSLPGVDALELLRKMRELPDTEIVILTGAGNEIDRILALELGADDYLRKPFHPRELVARIHALERMRLRHSVERRLRVDDIEIDREARTICWHGMALQLTTSEYELLEKLLRCAGHAVSREELASSVLARRFHPFDRSLDMLVSRLRKKLAPLGLADRIKTVRSSGYQFARLAIALHHTQTFVSTPAVQESTL